MRRHKAPRLVFDLDGTLSDPQLGIGRCFNHALQRHGFAPIASEAVTRCIGPPLNVSFAAITGQNDAALLAALVASYRERYADQGYAENTLYPGIPEVLGALHARLGPLALCTSKRVDFAHQILALFGLAAFFSVVNGGDVGIEKREQLKALLARGDIHPNAIMIGDRDIDINAAKCNGLRSAGVLWGHGAPGELEAAGPDWLLAQVPSLLQLA